VSILSAIGKKSVMLGVIDVGENEVEKVASLVARADEALRFLPKEQLILAPDCGMLELNRASARAKLISLSLAAGVVNER
jgi:5-methyltetrahydropteroyltriglutamate--homocysteine methyltransferase